MFKKIAVFLVLWILSNSAYAGLKVCNHSDLTLIAAVGFDVNDTEIATQGWWYVYPGFCEVLVDLPMLKGSYYVYAQTDPLSTVPSDTFGWGEDKPLCVNGGGDFKIESQKQCNGQHSLVKFNKVEKSWDNNIVVDIVNPKREYLNLYRSRVAGVQRMLSILGYDMGKIDGVLGKSTVTAINEISYQYSLIGLDFKQLFPVLEKLIRKKQ